MPALTYFEPTSVDEAIELLAAHGADARPLAGGQSLLMLMRHRLVQPAVLISLRRLDALRIIDLTSDGLTLGAMVTQRTIERDARLKVHYPAIAQAAAQVGSVPIRNLGTIGGNLCHGEPGADPPAAMIASGAELELLSKRGRRRVPAEDFFTDYLQTAIQPDELLVQIIVPPPPRRSYGAYLKFTRRAVDLAIVGVAVVIGLAVNDNRVEMVRIGINGGALVPVRARNAERALLGERLDSDTVAAAAEAAAIECDPIDDHHASARYKRKLIQVYVRRVLQVAARQAGIAV